MRVVWPSSASFSPNKSSAASYQSRSADVERLGCVMMQALHEVANLPSTSPSASEGTDKDWALISLSLTSFPVTLDYATVYFSYMSISKAKPTTAPFFLLNSALESIDRTSLFYPESEAFFSLVCCLMNSLDYGEGGVGTMGKIGKWALAIGGVEAEEPEWGAIERGEVANFTSDKKVGVRRFGFHFLRTLTSDPLHTFDNIIVSRLLERVEGDSEMKKGAFDDSTSGLVCSVFSEVVEMGKELHEREGSKKIETSDHDLAKINGHERVQQRWSGEQQATARSAINEGRRKVQKGGWWEKFRDIINTRETKSITILLIGIALAGSLTKRRRKNMY
ncbi:hypothetical protein TrCOL_g4941 [Triparma columacea]|uniref:Uncharacterized protein n=1 Tax=Triparma columacea TaxID=722753 RepID=A0A9W7G7T5_9STRA|nr:hypothetical protein TrCOL_g4941 [Triparma columacea]